MEELLTVKELSELLKISPRTLYDWTHTEFIPHCKFGKVVRFSVSDIEKWLQKRKRKGRGSYKRNIDEFVEK